MACGLWKGRNDQRKAQQTIETQESRREFHLVLRTVSLTVAPDPQVGGAVSQVTGHVVYVMSPVSSSRARLLRTVRGAQGGKG